MKEYVSKPSKCFAQQFGGFYATPYPEGVEFEDNSNDPIKERYRFYVVTTHGQKTYIEHGDFIVREPDGNGHYPVKPDIFNKRWELAHGS